MKTHRAYYSAPIGEFLQQSHTEILGELTSRSGFDVTLGQRQAWMVQIALLQNALDPELDGHILLEYSIPRMGKRIDAVVLLPSAIVPIEFKIGAISFDGYSQDQAIDYALDLKYFHQQSANALIVPVLVATDAPAHSLPLLSTHRDNVASLMEVNSKTLPSLLSFLSMVDGPEVDPIAWINSAYQPTPTIIEAAQVLYQGHGVKDISRSDAAAENLTVTAGEVNRIIDESKSQNRKSICIVTGVPGAGKTLVGLTIANDRHQFEESEHAVFLSGNGPLVKVLQEALARDEHERSRTSGEGVTKNDAIRKAKSFIQNIHHFRDDAIQYSAPPIEKVTLFDEAQRSWDEEQLNRFMKAKKGIPNFNQSEPDFLIEVMDRHPDWAVIVCLVGEGQEINTGEAGIAAWLEAIATRFTNWNVHISPRVYSRSFSREQDLRGLIASIGDERVFESESLHLGVSVRSFRSEKLSAFVELLLANEPSEAARLYSELADSYPIALTRDLDVAREWVRTQSRGSERYGLTATSGARRLRPHGVWVQSKVDPPNWFLNGKSDVRSSYGLEETATEFDIQGLELDWTIVCWDADLRYNGSSFQHQAFVGSRWNNIGSQERRMYLTNAYRVLLTRARQGMVIFVPKGDDHDHTRSSDFYDHTYEYLKDIGLQEI